MAQSAYSGERHTLASSNLPRHLPCGSATATRRRGTKHLAAQRANRCCTLQHRFVHLAPTHLFGRRGTDRVRRTHANLCGCGAQNAARADLPNSAPVNAVPPKSIAGRLTACNNLIHRNRAAHTKPRKTDGKPCRLCNAAPCEKQCPICREGIIPPLPQPYGHTNNIPPPSKSQYFFANFSRKKLVLLYITIIGIQFDRKLCRFEFSVFSFRNTKIRREFFGFDCGNSEGFVRAALPRRPGQSRSGTSRARAIDSLLQPFCFECGNSEGFVRAALPRRPVNRAAIDSSQPRIL